MSRHDERCRRKRRGSPAFRRPTASACGPWVLQRPGPGKREAVSPWAFRPALRGLRLSSNDRPSCRTRKSVRPAVTPSLR